MSKKLLFYLFTAFTSLCTFAQQKDPVAITINNKSILRSELQDAYKKANEHNNNEQKESFEDFLSSYVKMKLNIEEAINQNLDTLANYQRDLSAARVQLAHKYMQNTEYEDNYIRKIYNRLLENVEINQAFLPFNKDLVFPADTLLLYQQALALKKELEANGFEKEGYTLKDKPSTNIHPNGQNRNGYIGWVTPFMYPSAIEEAIYSLPINQVSAPIRSSAGYHIVQVLDKRPAIGTVELEQVLFSFRNIPPPQEQIDSVGKVAWREYNNIKSDEDYNSLCAEFTEVMKTGERGCYLGMITLESMMPTSFLLAAFNLEKAGEISQPVLTDYGYHLIRLLNKYPVPEFPKYKESLKKKIQESEKSINLRKGKKDFLSNKVDFIINQRSLEKLRDIANTTSPQDSNYISTIDNFDDVLFTIGGKIDYTVGNFAEYIRFRNQMLVKTDEEGPDMYMLKDIVKNNLSTDILNDYFDSYSSIKLSDYYYSTLEDRYPTFRKQLQDVSDGLLLYNVKNKNIWERTKTDSHGLSETFVKNRAKYKLKEPMFKGVVIFSKDEASLSKAKEVVSKHKNIDDIIQEIRNTINNNGVLVQMEPGLWKKGSNRFVDKDIFEGSDPVVRKDYPHYFVFGEFIDEPQDYTDVRSDVEIDFQEELEKNWDNYLQNKYDVKYVKSVLDKIK